MIEASVSSIDMASQVSYLPTVKLKLISHRIQVIEIITKAITKQINLLSLIGCYSIQVQKKAEQLIADSKVSFIGTDCHNMNHVELYKDCQKTKAWHTLANSKTLLNHTL